ncbi:MAG: hypothetical protein NZM42_11330 [Gemmatales bacterium]|nr:hypothetical protein [Gemmatales bacterium]MDW8222455.1 hypothetical protein [Gemmatales bacterium]
MAITFTCNGCGKQLLVSETVAGKRIRCPLCGHIGEVLAPSAMPSAPPSRVPTGQGVAPPFVPPSASPPGAMHPGHPAPTGPTEPAYLGPPADVPTTDRKPRRDRQFWYAMAALAIALILILEIVGLWYLLETMHPLRRANFEGFVPLLYVLILTQVLCFGASVITGSAVLRIAILVHKKLWSASAEPPKEAVPEPKFTEGMLVTGIVHLVVITLVLVVAIICFGFLGATLASGMYVFLPVVFALLAYTPIAIVFITGHIFADFLPTRKNQGCWLAFLYWILLLFVYLLVGSPLVFMSRAGF